MTAVSGPFTLRLVAFDHQPFPYQDLVNEVDSNRLRNDLTFVQGIRHRTGGPAHLAETQDTLRNCFAGTGIFVGEQTFTYQGYTGRNIYGTHRGTVQGQQVIVVDAHYDSVVNAPGADDNGSGTVGVMEIARLLSRYPTKNPFDSSGLTWKRPERSAACAMFKRVFPPGKTSTASTILK